MTTTTTMVVGFMFDLELKNVVLIRKDHPKRQVGKLNGPGGHCEEYEEPPDAMVREFEEEAGVRHEDWEWYATLTGEDWVLVCLCCARRDLKEVVSKTHEQIEIVPVGEVQTHSLVDHVGWLVPLALEVLRHDEGTLKIEAAVR